jgi:hypothetical protein
MHPLDVSVVLGRERPAVSGSRNRPIKSWTDRVSNKAQQVEFDDIVMSKNSQPVLNWAA